MGRRIFGRNTRIMETRHYTAGNYFVGQSKMFEKEKPQGVRNHILSFLVSMKWYYPREYIKNAFVVIYNDLYLPLFRHTYISSSSCSAQKHA